jgi:DNA-binding transcriptional LysR family regulator
VRSAVHGGLHHVHQPDQVVTVAFTPSLQSDDMATLKAAACAGVGIIALPGYMGRAEVARGQLVRVLPKWIAGVTTISLLMPSRRGLLPLGAYRRQLSEPKGGLLSSRFESSRASSSPVATSCKMRHSVARGKPSHVMH